MRAPIQIQPLARETSQRIDALRFLLVIAIVMIHARGHNIEVSGTPLGPESLGGGAWFFQEILSSVIARTAVPLFFLFSGFLTTTSLVRKGYTALLKGRTRTLLIPYLFWNGLVFSLHCIAAPETLATANPLVIFGFTEMPAAYQFWFIRDLILLVIAAPLIVAMAHRAPRLAILLALGLWLYSPANFSQAGGPIETSALCFFQIGAVFCLHKKSLAARWQRMAVAAYLPLAIFDAFVPDDTSSGLLIHHLALLVGMLAIWRLSGLLTKRHPLPAFLTGSAFMVYAAHEPLLGILKKVSYILFKPDGDLSVTAIYLVTATITVTACVVANSLAIRWMPKIHAIITGGRGPQLSQS